MIPHAPVLSCWPLVLVAIGCTTEAAKFPEIEPVARQWEIECTNGKAEGCYQLGRYLQGPAHAGASPEQAMTVLELGCGGGCARACGLLGTLYWRHHGQPHPSDRARQLLESSCSRDIAESCFVLARMKLQIDDADSVESAGLLFAKACRMGVSEGCAWAGRVFLQGRGLAVDRDRAMHWFSFGCAQHSAVSCDELATALESNGLTSLAQRVELKWRACHMGLASSCAWLSTHYVDPHHTEYDCTLGLRPAQLACTAHAADGCGVMAICADLAQLRPQVPRENKDLYRACGRGATGACYYLAQKLKSSAATDTELREAQRLYAHSCHQGDAMSCGAALTLSLPGTNEGDRPSKFLSELEKQCSGGNAEACVLLANQYQGGPRDLRDPYRESEFRHRACQLGHAASCVTP